MAVNGVGSTYMAHNSEFEIKMRTGISVDGGYDCTYSEAFIEEPFYSSNNNELQLSLQISGSLVQSSRDDIDTGAPFRAQAIISNPPTYGHVHVAEPLRMPWHIYLTMPWMPTNEFPHPLA